MKIFKFIKIVLLFYKLVHDKTDMNGVTNYLYCNYSFRPIVEKLTYFSSANPKNKFVCSKAYGPEVIE